MANPSEINPLYNKTFMKDPHPFFAEALQNKPVIRHPEYLTKPVSLFRYNDVKPAFKDWEKFSSAVSSTGETSDLTLGKAIQNIITMDPPRHTTLRRMAQQGFLPSVLNTFRPAAEKIIKERVDYALANDEIDLVNDFAAQITINMITTILGLPIEDWPMIRQWTIDIAENVMCVNWLTESEQKRMDVTARVVGEMSDYFANYIAERKKNPKDGDIVSILMSAEVDGVKYTDDEIESMTMLMLLAGNDSTATLIANYCRCMALFPEQANMVRKDPKLINASLEETLRYSPSFLCMERMATEDMIIQGEGVKKNDVIVLWIAAANRDPDIFENPNEFNIMRKPNAHIAFAYGPHMCLGAPLARMEATIMANEVMSRTSGLKLLSDPINPGNAILNGPLSQKIRFIPK